MSYVANLVREKKRGVSVSAQLWHDSTLTILDGLLLRPIHPATLAKETSTNAFHTTSYLSFGGYVVTIRHARRKGELETMYHNECKVRLRKSPGRIRNWNVDKLGWEQTYQAGFVA